MPAVNIYLSEEEYLTLAEIGKKNSKKVSEIAQQAIDKYLKKVEA